MYSISVTRKRGWEGRNPIKFLIELNVTNIDTTRTIMLDNDKVTGRHTN